MIPYGKQWINDEDIESVLSVLKSDWLTQGPNISDFENDIAEYCNVKYAVAVSNGTAALHIAVAALNLEKGFEGITSPITFLASSNCMIYNSGTPVFSDIKSDTYNIDVDKIKSKITNKTRLLIPVHFSGQPVELEKIKKIADENNLYIIEDAAHAIGSEYTDKIGKVHKIGDCAFSDMTILSFHPVKHITTAEGGMILTNNEELYERLLLLRTHGITKSDKYLTKNDGPWYYEMHVLGYNYRITDIQCALGMSQLKRLDDFVVRRREIVQKYNNAFQDMSEIKVPYEKDNVKSSYHLYIIQLNGKNKLDFYNYLRNEKNILCQVHYIPVHLQPYYKEKFGYKQGNYPVAENYYKKAISLPMYPKMTDNDVEYVIESVKEAMVKI